MVQYFQYPFGLRLLNTMVQGRKTKQHDKAEPVYTGPHDARHIGVVGRQRRKDGDADDAEEDAKSMDEAVYHFLLEGKIACGDI